MKDLSKQNLDRAMTEILAGYKNEALPLRDASHTPMPNRNEIIGIILNLHRVLFPGFFEDGEDSVLKSEDALDQLLYETYYKLKRQTMLAFAFFASDKAFSEFEEKAEAICDAFFGKLPAIQRCCKRTSMRDSSATLRHKARKRSSFAIPAFTPFRYIALLTSFTQRGYRCFPVS